MDMEIEWPSFKIKVTATLLEDRAPRVCSAVQRCLPFRSIQEHTMVSGQGLYCWAPIRTTAVDNSVPRRQGDVYFFNPGQLLVIIYGKTTEPIKVNKFAEIGEKDFEKVQFVGRRVWENTMRPKGEGLWSGMKREAIVVIFRG